MKTEKTSKMAEVLNHLKTFGSITSWEAIEKYGATRLAALIFILRKDYEINSVRIEIKDRFGNNTHFCKYVFVGEKAPEVFENA